MKKPRGRSAQVSGVRLAKIVSVVGTDALRYLIEARDDNTSISRESN